MARPSVRARHLRHLAFCAVGVIFAAPGAALAQCAADSTGINVTCTGTAAPYTNSASGVSVTVASGATVTGPLVIGNAGSLTNSGTIAGTTAIATVQYGDNATIVNGGSITSTGGATGSTAITVGNFANVTNNATLTAIAGTPAVQAGTGSTFTIGSGEAAAVSGNLVYSVSTGSNVSTFNNNSTAYGFVGTLISQGNTKVSNAGIWVGNLTQSAAFGTVNFDNAAAGTFTGIFSSQDTTNLTNEGAMFLYQGSALGGLYAGTITGTVPAPSVLTNSGTLTIGTTAAPAAVTVYGNFVQNSAGTLTIAIAPAAGAGAIAGTNYSQLYAHVLSGTNVGGTAQLAGTLALNVGAGFYPTGSTYNVILADKGITGAFSSITGNSLQFISFVPLGIVTVAGTQQAYEFQVQRTQTYAQALAGVGTPNQLAIAGGLQPLVATASANPTTDVATFVGEIDVLTLQQAKDFLDSVSPEGYFAYGTALRDQANAFTRTVALRLADQNSEHDEDGWWLTPSMQFEFGSVNNAHTRERMIGLTGGYDISGPNYVLGIAGDFNTDTLKYAPGTLNGHNRDFAVAGYGAYKLGPVRLTGQAAYNFGHLSAAKSIVIGSYSRSTTAATGEHAIKLTGTAGFDVKAAGVLFTPYVGIDYLNGKVSGFTEENAASTDLTVNGFRLDRTDLLAGATITRASGHFRPYVKAAYRSQIGTGAGNAISAYFDADPTTTFTVTPLAEPRHEIDADAGINWVFEDAGSLFLGYQGTYRGHYTSHGINLGIRLEF